MAESSNFEGVLKRFNQRASEAEDRLARLETALAGKKDNGNEELLKMVSELQSKLEDAQAEREKALKEVQKFSVENSKLQYRITHLVRALEEADCKLASK